MTEPVNKATSLGKAAALVAAIAGVIGCAFCVGLSAKTVAAQKAAAPVFEVASVKRNMACAPYGEAITRDTVPYINFDLTNDDGNAPPGGLFSAKRLVLTRYIAFAYNVPSYGLANPLSNAPKWVATECFDIEARGAANATRNEMRLMLQSLLSDRFKLAARWEARKAPSLVLTLAKPGKLGPELHPDTDKTPCGERPRAGQPMATVAGGYPAFCGGFIGGAGPGGSNLSARQMTMEELARYISGNLALGFYCPVVDRTGLGGAFDMKLSYTVDTLGTQPRPGDFQVAFIQALKEQLGLKLESTSGPVNELFIDHIEEPSAN